MEPGPQQTATRESWTNLQPLPAQRAALSIQREFTQQEYDQIRLGFIPERMEDRWCIFLEQVTLYVHRSWTGYCIFQLSLVKEGATYQAREAFANRQQSQYGGTDAEYDEELLAYLISSLLLRERSMAPMGADVPAGIATELHHQHVFGAGPREAAEPINLTLRGMLSWLWHWLRWLVGK